MKTESVLVKGMGKEQAEVLGRRACNEPAFFRVLNDLAAQDSGTISEKAVWALSTALTIDPTCGSTYLNGWIDKIEQGISDSVAREYMRGLLAAEWNEEQDAALLKCCEGILQTQGRDIGVYYNALRILNRLARKYPDLCAEITATAGRHIHSSSVGIRALAAKIVKSPGFIR